MDKIGIRELRRHASAIIRRVAAGETFEITDRGHVVALLVKKPARGLEPLIDQGMVPPSSSIAEGRGL